MSSRARVPSSCWGDRGGRKGCSAPCRPFVPPTVSDGEGSSGSAVFTRTGVAEVAHAETPALPTWAVRMGSVQVADPSFCGSFSSSVGFAFYLL